MVNGILMDQLKGINTPLKDGDSIILDVPNDRRIKNWLKMKNPKPFTG